MGTHTRSAGMPRHALAGAATMARFVIRRNWVRLVSWWVFVVGMFAYVVSYYRKTLDTQRLLDDFGAVAKAPGMRALTGLAADPATMGGAVWTKIWMTLALGLAFGMVFLVTRNARAEEESGRSELLRARVLGIHASSVATWAVLGLVCLLAGLATAGVSLATGLDPAGRGHGGSWLMGLSVTGVGLVAIGVAALAGQVTLTSRGANSLASSVIGILYVLRMVGDLGNGALTWASPIGWGQKTSPYGDNRWWPLALQVGTALVLVTLALVLEGRRDFGSGMLPERLGRADAPTRWTSPFGLSVRMERGALIGWVVTITVAGALFGSVIQSMQTMLADMPPALAHRLGGDSMDALASLLARVMALVVLVFALQATLPLREEESSGRLEVQLSRSLPRWRWMLSRLVIPAVGSLVLLALGGFVTGSVWDVIAHEGGHISEMVGATVVHWPAVLVMVGLAVAAFAVVPKVSVVITWLLVALVWLVEMLGTATDVSQKVWDALPFGATPALPSEPMDWAPVVVLVLVAIALVGVATWWFSRRDLQAD